uniref:Uncharacterized protein n=1 Tax=Arundo donax TaxID=35708 RepID=A0A0A9CDK4_ARUDO
MLVFVFRISASRSNSCFHWESSDSSCGASIVTLFGKSLVRRFDVFSASLFFSLTRPKLSWNARSSMAAWLYGNLSHGEELFDLSLRGSVCV